MDTQHYAGIIVIGAILSLSLIGFVFHGNLMF